jgi:hypothetical protein
MEPRRAPLNNKGDRDHGAKVTVEEAYVEIQRGIISYFPSDPFMDIGGKARRKETSRKTKT